MLIEVARASCKFLEDNKYNNCLAIKVDGEVVFEVSDGDPEDNRLGRNFNDCFIIPSILGRAFIAGKLDSDLISKGVDIDSLEEYKSFLEGGNV